MGLGYAESLLRAVAYKSLHGEPCEKTDGHGAGLRVSAGCAACKRGVASIEMHLGSSA